MNNFHMKISQFTVYWPFTVQTEIHIGLVSKQCDRKNISITNNDFP